MNPKVWAALLDADGRFQGVLSAGSKRELLEKAKSYSDLRLGRTIGGADRLPASRVVRRAGKVVRVPYARLPLRLQQEVDE
ncbi:MAG: hypothetical protein ABIJ21_06320 [Nanoarchaeota archaeon]